MGLLDDAIIPRRNLSIYFLIDSSANMSGPKIGSVNDSMQNILPLLREIDNSNPDANILLYAIVINDRPYNMYEEGKTPHDFVWQNIEAKGDFYFGKALDCLTKNVKREYSTQDFDPIFILLASSPSKDVWDFHLKRLRNIETFEWGHKIAIAIGDDCDREMLLGFTGSEEAVIGPRNNDSIKNLIKLTLSYPEWFASEGAFQGCKGDMALIIDKCVELYGKDIVLSPRMFHILNDYEAFKGNRSHSFIFKTIQKDSRFERLVNSDNWHLDSVVFSYQLSQETGIEPKKLQSVLDAIGLGIGMTIYLDIEKSTK